MENENRIIQLLSVTQAAHLLNISTKTIYYLVSRNKIPFIRIGKHLRFHEGKLLNFLEENTREGIKRTTWHLTPVPLESPRVQRSLTTRRVALAHQKGVGNGNY